MSVYGNPVRQASPSQDESHLLHVVEVLKRVESSGVVWFGLSVMTENVPPRAPALRVRFTPGDDMALIQVVVEVRPMCDPGKWQEVARLVLEITGKVCTPRRVREGFDLLLVQFRRKDTKNRTRSGVEEDFSEWERLLQELTDLAAEWGYKPRAVERQRRRQKELNDTNVAARPAASQAARAEAADEMQAAASEAYAAAALGMLNHVINVHNGDHSPYPRCLHGDVPNGKWLIPDYVSELMTEMLQECSSCSSLRKAEHEWSSASSSH
ncbi:hypothetical protein HPB50_011479 [Hyalomma asiaticum]|uniref:Uncharacterized protein n=1 Tax=Hyalomma asiaticum TaxID=266040 RepID=A0ACB7SQ74_HYAAI|nr:hypothetical protein HPB50_011479 [Hyalomma asiaticum]